MNTELIRERYIGAGFRIDLKEREEFGQSGKRNYDILEKRKTLTKDKKSGRCIHGKPRWSVCPEEG